MTRFFVPVVERGSVMDRQFDDTRAQEREQSDKATPESGAATEHNPPVWVVDMKSHRVVRRRAARHLDRQGAVHSER